MPPPKPDYRKILLSLIASLSLDDHMGDVSNSVSEALKQAEIEIEWEDWEELQRGLHALGIETLWDTSLKGEE